MPKTIIKGRRIPWALGGSLLLHGVLAGWLWLRPSSPPVVRGPSLVELEVYETPRVAPPASAPAHVATPAPKPAPDKRPVAKRAGGPASRTPSVPTVPPPAAEEGTGGVAVSDVPRASPGDLPKNGAFGTGALSLGVSSDTARLLVEPRVDPPDAGPSEQALVKGRVDSMLTEALSQQRAAGAVDGAVQGLGRSFEGAARRASVAPELQRWIDSAVANYRKQAARFGGLGKETTEWERIEGRALQGFDRDGATYVTIVELRQGSDGSLLDLKLVSSSGAQEFDQRALGSVVDGVRTDATAFGGPKAQGKQSLWALMGYRQSDSDAVETAKKVYRYVLLDVVDLKPTMIQLEKGGGTERLRFSARLLAVY